MSVGASSSLCIRQKVGSVIKLFIENGNLFSSLGF